MARTTLADYREFVRVSIDLPENPKLAMIDDPAAGWAYVVSLCYCGRNLTDGEFPVVVVVRGAGVKPGVGRRLIEADLWHEAGHGCERCPQPTKAGMAVVHDYLEHQRSASEATSLRDARREAGRRGAASRWSGDDGNSHSNSHSKGDGKSMANAWQVDGKSMAEGEREEKKTTSSSDSSAIANEDPPEPPPRDDVEQLCARVADHTAANSNQPRPTITKRWRDHARLLLDKDLAAENDPLGLALRVADWAAANTFWSSNILSMPKLRQEFARLRIQARQEWEASRSPHLRLASGGGHQRTPTTTQRVQDALALLDPEGD